MTPEQWLKENDRRLWTNRPKVSKARAQCEKACGEKVSAKKFKELREMHCVFWGKERFGRPFYTSALTEKQWAKLTTFLKANSELIKGQPLDFVVRWCRANKVPANPAILAGSETYKALQ